jgi:hypothetical protein
MTRVDPSGRKSVPWMVKAGSQVGRNQIERAVPETPVARGVCQFLATCLADKPEALLRDLGKDLARVT